MIIRVRVCPECGSYYGSSSDHDLDLSTRPRAPKVEDRLGKSDAELIEERGSRVHCPFCLLRGKRVERGIHEFHLSLPSSTNSKPPIQIHSSGIVSRQVFTDTHGPSGPDNANIRVDQKPVVVIDELRALIAEHGHERAMEILDAATR